MRWSEVQSSHPNEWLVIEAVDSHMEERFFVVDDVAVLQRCPDGSAAFELYRRLHRGHPERELLFVHTSQPELRIEERRWIGIRTGI